MSSRISEKKNVLITGSTGLIGSDFLKIYGKKYNIYQIHYNKKKKSFKYNLSKINYFKKIPDKFEVLIYLAQSNNFKNPIKFKNEIINVNFINFKNLVKKLNDGNKIKKVIYASTGSVYINKGKVINERSETKNLKNDIYSKSKLMSENFLKKYNNRKFEYFIGRIFFAYGKNQKKHMLIKSLISKIKLGNSIYLNGKTGIKINPIHSMDVCKIFDKCINSNIEGIYNIAGSEVLSIKNICNKISLILKKKPNYVTLTKSDNLVGGIKKLKKHYNPKIMFKDKIKELIK